MDNARALPFFCSPHKMDKTRVQSFRYVTSDPRWQLKPEDLKQEVDSQVNTIDRTYGTASQKIRYPKYTDFLRYGILSVPRWDLPHEIDSPESPF